MMGCEIEQIHLIFYLDKHVFLANEEHSELFQLNLKYLSSITDVNCEPSKG